MLMLLHTATVFTILTGLDFIQIGISASSNTDLAILAIIIATTVAIITYYAIYKGYKYKIDFAVRGSKVTAFIVTAVYMILLVLLVYISTEMVASMLVASLGITVWYTAVLAAIGIISLIATSIVIVLAKILKESNDISSKIQYDVD